MRKSPCTSVRCAVAGRSCTRARNASSNVGCGSPRLLVQPLQQGERIVDRRAPAPGRPASGGPPRARCDGVEELLRAGHSPGPRGSRGGRSSRRAPPRRSSSRRALRRRAPWAMTRGTGTPASRGRLRAAAPARARPKLLAAPFDLEHELAVGLCGECERLAGRSAAESLEACRERRLQHLRQARADLACPLRGPSTLLRLSGGTLGAGRGGGAHGAPSRPWRARKSAVVFSCGNGSCGTGTPSAAHDGSQPSPGRHSSSRSGGKARRTASLWRS